LDGWTTSLDVIVWPSAACLHVIQILNICYRIAIVGNLKML
jgi:hypothetical protein